MKALTPAGEHKDWNDQLKDIKTHNTNNLDEWKTRIEAERRNSASKDSENNKHYERFEKI